ncbi:hypothetical protein HYX70_00650 [Candidatus Saccharibacteria bacterium]|nr:hypothetical protein [Candidatus Saccharibacteria bacterium]
MKSKIWPVVIGLSVLAVALFIGFAITRPDVPPGQAKTSNTTNKSTDSNIVSNSEIHWHPKLAVYINGQKQEIPAETGIGQQYAKSRWYDSMMQMANIHTHDNSGQLHWEVMEGPVRKDQVRLSAFFDVWDKKFSKIQVFDKTDPKGSKITMTVNGQPNSEFENYMVADNDQIEIKYQD